jgi:hypothetical protein
MTGSALAVAESRANAMKHAPDLSIQVLLGSTIVRRSQATP